MDFNKIYQLPGLKPKNKGHTNFYECCDLTKIVYLVWHISIRSTYTGNIGRGFKKTIIHLMPILQQRSETFFLSFLHIQCRPATIYKRLSNSGKETSCKIYQYILLTAELAKAKVVTGIAIGTAADIDENGGGGGGGYDAKWAGSLRG